MTFDEINALQQLLDQGAALDAEQCEALIAEVRRLKTEHDNGVAATGAARNEGKIAAHALSEILAENAALKLAIERLRANPYDQSCQLEERWSNCAIRLTRATLRK